jgi:hypothetical protein
MAQYSAIGAVPVGVTSPMVNRYSRQNFVQWPRSAAAAGDVPATRPTVAQLWLQLQSDRAPLGLVCNLLSATQENQLF